MSDPNTTKAPGEDEPPRRQRSVGVWLRSLVKRGEDSSLRDDLLELIEQRDDADREIGPEERIILSNLVKLGELRVDDVMIPRADIIAIDATSTLDGAIKLFREEFHSRFPVYRDTLDNVVGMIHIKDLMAFWGNEREFDLPGIVREVLFVPRSMPVPDLLLRMRTKRVHMAIVVDEYGGTDGLATIEDLVEAIVGEIDDEHDEIEVPLIVEARKGLFEVDGRAEVEELEQRLGVDFLPEDRDEDIDTVAGLVASLAGRVPQRGEVISHPDGIEFQVVEADPRRAIRLRVRRVEAKRDAPAPAAGTA